MMASSNPLCKLWSM